MRSMLAPLLIVAATAAGYWYTSQPARTDAAVAPAVPAVDDPWGFAEWAPATLADDPRRRLLIGYAAEQVAALIETDGRLTEHRIPDTAAVAALWAATLDYATRGAGAVPESFAAQFAKVCDSQVGLTPGGEGAELDDPLRAKAVQMFRALAQSLR